MENFITITVIAIIIVAALIYVIRAKKKGNGCIGCPMSTGCDHCGCSCNKK